MLVVLDAGIWISGLRFGGVPFKAILIASVAHRLASCNEIDEEVERILLTKYKWPAERTRREMNEYLTIAKRVLTTGALQGICRDSDDDMVLECAAMVRADIIVSGDKDLLVLEGYAGTTILTPRQYVDLYWDPTLA